MSPKVHGLDGARPGGCQKHSCKVFAPLDRHHMGSQKLFVHNFAWRQGSARYDKFVVRYYKFAPTDVVLLCRAHHGALHTRYHVIIRRHCRRNRKHVESFSWAEAFCLMRELQKFCKIWLAR